MRSLLAVTFVAVLSAGSAFAQQQPTTRQTPQTTTQPQPGQTQQGTMQPGTTTTTTTQPQAFQSPTKVKLLTPTEVTQRMTTKNVRILDVRPAVKDYFPAHVANAVHLADATLRGPQNGIPVQYWPLDMEANILKSAGITGDTQVIVYSEGEDVLGATMAMYILQRLGHDNLALMNGGWTAFRNGQTQQISQKYPTYKPGDLKVKENKAISANLTDIQNFTKTKPATTILVDARPAAQFRGETKTWQRNGHIPGAINIDWHQLVMQDNPHQLKPVDQLKQIFTAAGVTPDKNVILYCGTSREASLEFVALRNYLNYPNVRLYEGSWTQYAATELPIETGAGTTLGVGGAGTTQPSTPGTMQPSKPGTTTQPSTPGTTQPVPGNTRQPTTPQPKNGTTGQ